MSDSSSSIEGKIRDAQIFLAQSFGALFFPANRGQGPSHFPTGRTRTLTGSTYSCLPDGNSHPNGSAPPTPPRFYTPKL